MSKSESEEQEAVIDGFQDIILDYRVAGGANNQDKKQRKQIWVNNRKMKNLGQGAMKCPGLVMLKSLELIKQQSRVKEIREDVTSQKGTKNHEGVEYRYVSQKLKWKEKGH